MKYLVYDFVVADRSLVASGKSFSFRAYTDRMGMFKNPGARVIYDDGTKDTRTGHPIGKPFSIGQSHYKLQAREGQEDYSQKSLYEFFLYTPFTEGSPNGDYFDKDGNPVPPRELGNRDKNIAKLRDGEWTQLNVKLKLLDSEKDAELALETGLKRAEAQISAGQIDEETLSQIAAMIGEFGESEKSMRLKVYEFAGKRPIDYFNYLGAGDRAVRALIRKGLADNVLTQKGSVIFWEQTILGNDENSAVATLIGDEKIKNALTEKVNFKFQKTTKPKPKNGK